MLTDDPPPFVANPSVRLMRNLISLPCLNHCEAHNDRQDKSYSPHYSKYGVASLPMRAI